MKKYKIDFKIVEFKQITIEAESADEALQVFQGLALHELEKCEITENYDVDFEDIKEVKSI